MKILLLTQVLPYPPDSGPKIKTYNLIKFLAMRHEITLVSYVRGDQSLDVEHLKRYCREVFTVPIQRGIFRDALALVKSLLSNDPWIITRDDRKAMRDVISDINQKNSFDIVHADQLNMAQFTHLAPGVKSVLDAHNALWVLYHRLAQNSRQPFMRLLWEREWRLMKRYEGKMGRVLDAVITVSSEDKAAFDEAMGQKTEIPVIPIAVDTTELTPICRKNGANHILHIGTMFWPPNVDGILWFLREVYPIICQARPDIPFDIVGARPPKEITETARTLPGVHVTGYVKDPTEYLQNAGVFIVPLRAGGGMRVKILEALAKGMPIVTTSIGCEGIAVENGKHVIIADTPQDFAKATLQLIENPDRANTLIKQGRELAEAVYDYQIAYRPLNQLYEELGGNK
jgi:polysaccharide biosynthesis protein PslH